VIKTIVEASPLQKYALILTLISLSACQAMPPVSPTPPQAANSSSSGRMPAFHTQAQGDIQPGRLVVSLEPGAALPPGYKLVRRLAGGGDALVTAAFLNSSPAVQAAVRRLEEAPGVVDARPVHIFHIFGTPNDTEFPQQWGMAKVKAPAAWDRATGERQAVTVAVIDSGIDLAHPDLQAHLVPGVDYISPTEKGRDANGHGTHVAGIIGAVANNGQGVAGMNWGAKLMPVRVMSADGSGTDVDIAEGIRWAADHGAKVLNMSLGGYQNEDGIRAAVEYAQGKGCLVVAAMGNDAIADPAYPAAIPGVLAVGATSQKDERASFSNSGSWMSVSAPGVGIFSTMPTYATKIPHTKPYGPLSGTSMAAPMVAGLASLVWSKHPDWTAQQVRQRLEQTADDLGASGKDDTFGYGRINAERALAES
jgi:type VII secretion-associated serine protease mycosin